MRLSVLDQSVAVAGRPHGDSIRNTVALARHCEALGYDRFWVSEHHNHPTIVGSAPEIVMAAIAATTERIRIGSFVFNNELRHPAVLAQDLATLDVLSGGRLDIGLGAGWNRPEHDAIGLPFAPRASGYPGWQRRSR